MKPYLDSDLEYDVIWFFAHEDALEFPGRHRFSSRNYEDKKRVYTGDQVGETTRVRRYSDWRDGSPPFFIGWEGQRFCGDLEFFRDGARLADQLTSSVCYDHADCPRPGGSGVPEASGPCVPDWIVPVGEGGGDMFGREWSAGVGCAGVVIGPFRDTSTGCVVRVDWTELGIPLAKPYEDIGNLPPGFESMSAPLAAGIYTVQGTVDCCDGTSGVLLGGGAINPFGTNLYLVRGVPPAPIVNPLSSVAGVGEELFFEDELGHFNNSNPFVDGGYVLWESPDGFYWDMGDGTIYDGPYWFVNHTYAAPGTYVVQVRSYNSCGNSATVSFTMFIS